ncbi:hypothetical protein C0991_005043 [Blastosporella zonata]|nr:hypothetical protein C0991_005043 [Blastosporella zonata]
MPPPSLPALPLSPSTKGDLVASSLSISPTQCPVDLTSPTQTPPTSLSLLSTKRKHEVMLDNQNNSSPLNPPPTTPSKASVAPNLVCNIESITCGNTTYKVVKEIFHSQSLVGRGTRVWEALSDKGKAVIIKESWILQGRVETEAMILENFHAPQIPWVIDSSILHPSTSLFRQDLGTGWAKCREKCRIVEEPVCHPLATVRSRLEFLGAFLDYVKAMIHGDISASNLMLYDGPVAEDTEAPSSVKASKAMEILSRAAPFMAIPLLRTPTSPHCVGYDLESLFYVLIFFVVQVQAFNVLEGGKFSGRLPDHIADWFSTPNLRRLAAIKASQFHIYLDIDIFGHVTRLFTPLVPYLQRMWTALYPDGCRQGSYEFLPQDCCEEFIEILEEAILAEESWVVKAQVDELTQVMIDHEDEDIGLPSKKSRTT